MKIPIPFLLIAVQCALISGCLSTCRPSILEGYSAATSIGKAYSQSQLKTWSAFHLCNELNPERNKDVVVVCSDANASVWIANRRYALLSKSKIKAPSVWNSWLVADRHSIPVSDEDIDSTNTAWTAYDKTMRTMYHVPPFDALQYPMSHGEEAGVLNKLSNTNLLDVVKIFNDNPNCIAIFVGNSDELVELPKPGRGEYSSDVFQYLVSPRLMFLGDSYDYQELVEIVRSHAIENNQAE